MFNFAVTPLGNLFFAMAIMVFVSLFYIRRGTTPFLLHLLLFVSLTMIFYASDLITLFIGWEVMSWSSYFIIARNAKPRTLQKYILFNLGAGFALLGAIVIIYSFTGTALYHEIDISKIPATLHLPLTLLLLVTIFVKSGVLPFHYWVVDTYEESSHLFSAILSAMISKAGIFLFILMFTQIIGYEQLDSSVFTVVAWLGVITSVVATFKAISQDSMKRLLAYSSIAQIGYIITIFSVLNGSGLEAGLYHTMIHTMVKLLLFVNIASIIAITGKERFSELGGLIYRYPVLFVLLLIGIIGLAGMPPLGGFNSKFLIYTTLLEEKRAVLLTAVMFSSASAFLYCFKLIYGIYLGQPTQPLSQHKKLSLCYYVPQWIGAILLVTLGIFPSLGTIVLNPILASLGFEVTAYQSLFILDGGFASFNGGILMLVFGSIFAWVLLITTSMKNRTRQVRDRLDISYCGEVPDPKINLHYGYGIGEELRRIGFIRVILQNSVAPYWERIATVAGDSSLLLKKLYGLTVQNVGVVTILFFVLLLFMGVQ
jgi:NADH-quinone oxidoreductase subunit M